MAPDPLEPHYRIVARELAECRVVPLLGSGVNRCNRDGCWEPRQNLPDGSELAAYLAEHAGYPGQDVKDLLRVSQYYSVMLGTGPLKRDLHDIFDVESPPTAVHDFFARLPSILREREPIAEYPLIVTTNYDDALERAFEAAGEEFDLLVYAGETQGSGNGGNGDGRAGIFLHIPPGGDVRPIYRPNEYADVSLKQRPAILKMHGAIDRTDSERDTYVIAEDNYIDYLTRSDISDLVPALLARKLKKSHFLFLGYSLRDWNLRVILYRIWGKQALSNDTWTSWAIQLEPELIDQKLWSGRGVEILDKRLEDYIVELERRLTQESGVAV